MQYRIVTDNPNWPAILLATNGEYLCCDSIEEAQELLTHLRVDRPSYEDRSTLDLEHEEYEDDYPQRPEREYLRGTIEDY